MSSESPISQLGGGGRLSYSTDMDHCSGLFRSSPERKEVVFAARTLMSLATFHHNPPKMTRYFLHLSVASLSDTHFKSSPFGLFHLSTVPFFFLYHEKINALQSSSAHSPAGCFFLILISDAKMYWTCTNTYTHTHSSQNDLIQMQVVAFKSKIFGPRYQVRFLLW